MTRVANGFCAPLANISERILDIDELITVQRWKGPSAFDPLTLRMAASIWLRLKKNGCTTGSVAAKKTESLNKFNQHLPWSQRRLPCGRWIYFPPHPRANTLKPKLGPQFYGFYSGRDRWTYYSIRNFASRSGWRQ